MKRILLFILIVTIFNRCYISHSKFSAPTSKVLSTSDSTETTNLYTEAPPPPPMPPMPPTPTPTSIPPNATSIAQPKKTNMEHAEGNVKHDVLPHRDNILSQDVLPHQDDIPSPIVAYSYPKKIRQGERGKFIYVNVNQNGSSLVIRALKHDIVTFKADDLKKEDTLVIDTVSIEPYKYLTITVENPNLGVIIDSTPDQPTRQLIDTVHGNKWKWEVYTDTAYNNIELNLHVVGERFDGHDELAFERQIPIKISLEMNFFKRLWTFLVAHPQISLTLLIIPLITTLWKYFTNIKGNAGSS